MFLDNFLLWQIAEAIIWHSFVSSTNKLSVYSPQGADTESGGGNRMLIFMC